MSAGTGEPTAGPASAAAEPAGGPASPGGGEPSGVATSPSPAAAASQATAGPSSGDAQTWPDRSADLAECVGQATGAPELGREVVSEALIRHWVEAMGDHNPVYVSAEAARAAGYDDVIAPPTMLQAWVMRGLRATLELESRRAAAAAPVDDADAATGGAGPSVVATGPATQPTGDAGQTANDRMMSLLDEEGRTSVVATNCEQHYERPLHLGERLVASSVIEAVSDPKRTALGDGRFATTRLDFRALPDPGPGADPVEAFANGEPVATMRFRILKFRPGTAQAPPSGQAVRPTQAAPSAQAPPSGQVAAATQAAPSGQAAAAPSAQGGPAARTAEAAGPGQAAPPAAPAGQTRPLRPRPAITEDNAFFFEGLRAGKLLIQRCQSCGTLRHPPLPACGTCRSFEWDTVEASGRGELYSFVVVHYPQVPAFDYPLPIGLLALEEGTRLVADLHQVDPADLYVGMPMVADFVALDPELTLPFFRPGRG